MELAFSVYNNRTNQCANIILSPTDYNLQSPIDLKHIVSEYLSSRKLWYVKSPLNISKIYDSNGRTLPDHVYLKDGDCFFININPRAHKKLCTKNESIPLLIN